MYLQANIQMCFTQIKVKVKCHFNESTSVFTRPSVTCIQESCVEIYTSLYDQKIYSPQKVSFSTLDYKLYSN